MRGIELPETAVPVRASRVLGNSAEGIDLFVQLTHGIRSRHGGGGDRIVGSVGTDGCEGVDRYSAGRSGAAAGHSSGGHLRVIDVTIGQRFRQVEVRSDVESAPS